MKRQRETVESLTTRRGRWWLVLALGLVVGTPSLAQTEVASWTIDGGGQTSSGGSFEVSGTVGQPDADSLTGGSFEVQGGFWTSENPFVPVELQRFEIVSCPRNGEPSARLALVTSVQAAAPDATIRGPSVPGTS